ncbi:MAG: D-alanyl-D-alanine carboxypeptidase [Lachnospiraceae bacterium]|nr:D-alanyl-D-alanine carboxypeptidase [Lachnospiraceae bacterium]
MRLFRNITAAFLCAALLLCSVQTGVSASEITAADTTAAEWPTGPDISSETAILIEAETGTILYEKNMHQQMYPASITKILTCLIAVEEADLDDNVTFTQEVLDTIPVDSSRIWVNAGEYLSMDECLQAILIASANDVAAGVAEYISGSIEAFADLMNERAEELGCEDSHFANPHGYHDENHYTSAYDMAQIARAFFSVDILCTYSSSTTLHLYPSEGRDVETLESNKNQLLEGRTYEYEYLVGSKTGYTDMAGQTLVSCAQKDGMRLICVVMNAESPQQYVDTIELFEFGFNNFTTVNISENDTTYVSDGSSYDVDVIDVLGNSTPLLSMDTDAFVVLPNGADFSDISSYITLADEEENGLATVHYLYDDHAVGTARIYMNVNETAASSTTAASTDETVGELETEQIVSSEENEDTAAPKRVLFVNIRNILIAVLVIAAISLLFYFFRKPIKRRLTIRMRTVSLRTRYRKRQENKTPKTVLNPEPVVRQKKRRANTVKASKGFSLKRYDPKGTEPKPRSAGDVDDYEVSRYLSSQQRRRKVQMFNINDDTGKSGK